MLHVSQGSQIMNNRKHLDVSSSIHHWGTVQAQDLLCEICLWLVQKTFFPECEAGLNCKKKCYSLKGIKCRRGWTRPAYSFTADCSLHDFILGYMIVSLSSFSFSDAVGQFLALTPWPASPEIPITAEMLLFSYWTPHRLGHQSVSFGFSHTEKEANGSFFFSLSRRAEARENIAPQLTSNQIALGFHSLCPHSICTNHHGPPRISHPAQSNTHSFSAPSSPSLFQSPPPIDCSPLGVTRAYARMRTHVCAPRA